MDNFVGRFFVHLGKQSSTVKLSENEISDFLKSIPGKVKVVAVSKTKPAEEVLKVYNTGHRVFGENRVQEMISKAEILPMDIEWHLVGHLQSNKVKYIAGFVNLIHSVDSMKLLKVIDQEALKVNRIIDVLLQIYIASEETKFGLDSGELIELLSSPEINSLKNVNIRGLMGIASFTDDMDRVRTEFRGLRELFEYCKLKYFKESVSFSDISMGMSGDYKIAIEEGATIIRIGSLIFGERNYL
jgi:PLP dependent protein